MRLPKSSPKAENRLRSWLDQNVRLRQKLGQIQPTDSQAMAASRPEPAPAFADRDLKDAVADNVAPYDRERERAGLLARLPGLQIPPARGCLDFARCGIAPLALDLEANEPVEPAIRAMLRPWIWLAEALGQNLIVIPSTDPNGPRILAISLKKLGLQDVGLNLRAESEGGVHLWFDRGLELADAYGREHSLRFR